MFFSPHAACLQISLKLRQIAFMGFGGKSPFRTQMKAARRTFHDWNEKLGTH